MLFVQSKTLRHELNGQTRINLLEQLENRGFPAAIRSARIKCFEQVLGGADDSGEMETQLGFVEEESRQVFVRGDLFCLRDHVFFLIFEEGLIKSGIVYVTQTLEPFRKLDSFCQSVRELLIEQNSSQFFDSETPGPFPHWEHGQATMPSGFKSFVGKQDTDSLYTSLRKKTMGDRVRAAVILEDSGARLFLRRVKEAHIEGYAAKLLAGDTLGAYQPSIERLAAAGLVEHEVQVSCRKTGHALFRLPNAHALAVVTVSDATCSECGAPVADEKVEEVIAPTRLASSLLEDGSWLISRLHQALRELGVPESEIAVGPSEGDGYGQMMSNICGESFLLVARDGDLTPAFARWAIDLEIETEASHLVVIATGRVHNQAGALLQNHAARRVRAGQDFELIVADDAATASEELRRGFERVAERVVAEELCDLDGELGLSITQLILTKFRMLRFEEDVTVPAVAETEVEPAFERPPLSLAAHASVGAPEFSVVEEPIIQPIDESSLGEVNGNDAHLDSSTMGERALE
jgi:hypothetical protein